MEREIIFSSEFIQITKESDGFYIESYKKGMQIDQFNKLMSQHAEIKITSFMAIKNALLFAPKPPIRFGDMKERVEIEISSDELRAYVILNISETEFAVERTALAKEVIQKLREKGVVFGIKREVLAGPLQNNKQILIAEGIPPLNGQDSIIKMYEIKEAKPEVKEDGNVDHYELNLINKVRAGDWLGERHDPTVGVPGKSVKGNVIPAMVGKKYPLVYDKSSVKEEYMDGITTLYALRSGAVSYEGEMISVSNHLEINGNVDFKTGNIDFEGYLTVKGSVEDNFIVTAGEDIEVLGVYGVGGVKEISSLKGSVFIKGGIAGKGKAIVKAKKDIYIKYVSDATIICEGSVHIGFYCLNSTIIAKQVILDSPKGQIIGGSIQAEIKIISSIIGSASEKRTLLSVKGFDRDTFRDRLEKVVVRIDDLKREVARYKQEMSIYFNTSQLSREQAEEFEKIRDTYFKLKDEARVLESERKALGNYLRTKGEGEVTVLKVAYPNTQVEMSKVIIEIAQTVFGTTFYLQDGEIKQI